MEEFAKLCCHIVEDFYGSFHAHIFRQLARFGRLAIQQIAQKCRLPLRHVKAGVATLVQLRLVYHHTTPEGLSTYQANTTNAYNILRTGRLVELVNRELGASAAALIEALAMEGLATSHDLQAQVLDANGLADFVDIKYFRTLLKQLISSNYIKAVREAHFVPAHDARRDTERIMQENGTLVTGTGKKIKAEADTKVDLELEKRINDSISTFKILQELDAPPAQDNVMLKVDYSNLIIRIRNDRMAKFAENMFGRKIAQVARAACSQVGDIQPCSLPSRLSDISGNFMHQLDIAKLSADVSDTANNGQAVPNGLNGHHGRRVNGAMRGDRIVEHHLAVLAQGSFTFLIQSPVETRSWYIDKGQFSKYWWDKEMYRLVGEALSEPATRIVRMLADKGKLDERTMLDVGLLNAKELRQSLSSLQRLGFLELQEVPKDPQRQPKNTIFLYFYDTERVRKALLDRLYKTMSRMYERLNLEREEVASTLNKLDRFEAGREEEVLPAGELQDWYRWRQKESWFMTEIHRMDDSIVILRDT